MYFKACPSSSFTAFAPEDLKSLRNRLLEEKAQMLAMYQQDVHAAREIQEEVGEDFEELAAMDVDRELLYSMSESELEKLGEIEEALERMANGTYGRCLSSGELIPLERLREVPWTRYSLEAQTLVEEGLLDENRLAVS